MYLQDPVVPEVVSLNELIVLTAQSHLGNQAAARRTGIVFTCYTAHFKFTYTATKDLPSESVRVILFIYFQLYPFHPFHR